MGETKIAIEPSFSASQKKAALLHFDKLGSKSDKQMNKWKGDLCIIRPSMVYTVMSAQTIVEIGGKGEADKIIVMAEEHSIRMDDVMASVKSVMTVPSPSAVLIFVPTQDGVAVNYGAVPKSQVIIADDFKDFTSWWPHALRFLFPPTPEQLKAKKPECVFLYDADEEKDVKWYNRNRKAMQQFGLTCIWPGMPQYADAGVPITVDTIVVALLNNGGSKVKEKHGTIIDEASKMKAKILLVAEFTEDLASMEDIAVRLYKKHHKQRLVFDLMKHVNIITNECAMGKRVKTTMDKVKMGLFIAGMVLLVLIFLGVIVGMIFAKLCAGIDCTEKFPILKCFKFVLFIGQSKSRKIKPLARGLKKLESSMKKKDIDVDADDAVAGMEFADNTLKRF